MDGFSLNGASRGRVWGEWTLYQILNPANASVKVHSANLRANAA
jgi:hypothetical protein